MKRVISLALGSLSLAAFAGRVYTWTGAQDSRWTNPANWTVDGAVATRSCAAAFCPGALKVRVPNVDGTRKVNVITFTDFVPETIPDVEIVNGEPAKWISRVSGSTLKVLKVSGTQIVIR